MSFDPIAYGLLRPQKFDLDKIMGIVDNNSQFAGAEATMSNAITFSLVSGQTLDLCSEDVDRFVEKVNTCDKDMVFTLTFNGIKQVLRPCLCSRHKTGKFLTFYLVLINGVDIIKAVIEFNTTSESCGVKIYAKME